MSALMKCVHSGLVIVPIPISSDNYSYLIIDELDKTAILIDAADPEAIQVQTLTMPVLLCLSLLCSYIALLWQDIYLLFLSHSASLNFFAAS